MMRHVATQKIIDQLTKLVDNIQHEGGSVTITVDHAWRKLHFTPGMSCEFILTRMTQTVETLVTWLPPKGGADTKA